MKEAKEKLTGASVEESLEALKQHLSPVRETEIAAIDGCVGRITAEDIFSQVDLPSFEKSAMDGYAVVAGEAQSAAEKGKSLKVVEELFAGDWPKSEYRPDTAVRVMTGAPVPKGYDAVVKQEDTDYGKEYVKLLGIAVAGQNICPKGEDIKKGELLCPAGSMVTPTCAGLLAGIGLKEVSVLRRPRICIIATGDELTEPGRPLMPGRIYDTVSYMLSASAKRQGIETVFRRICGDNQEKCRELIEEAAVKADFIVTVGAVSVGKKDFIPSLLKNMKSQIIFKKADIQPGTPTMAAIFNGKPVLCLSGNPYAALVNFEVYFWDCMAAMTNCREMGSVCEEAVLADVYPKINKHRRFLRAEARGGKVYLPETYHAASVIGNMKRCNCLLDLEAGRGVKPGDTVRIRYIK